MKTKNRRMTATVLVLLACLLPTSVGCDEIAGSLAEAIGTCIGDIVSIVATDYLETVWVAEAVNEGERGSGPLHDYAH